MAHPSKFSPIKRARVLTALADGYSLAHACRENGLNTATVNWWKRKDPAFAAALAEAIEHGTDRLEDEARRRAVEGTEEPIYSQGKVVGTTRKYSDTLLIFMLKARRPEKFRDNVHVSADNNLAAAFAAAVQAGARTGDAQATETAAPVH